jgi:hypothetical protein
MSMIDEQPELEGTQAPTEKLVLPGSSVLAASAHSGPDSGEMQPAVAPTGSTRAQSSYKSAAPAQPPLSPAGKIGYFWKRDAAYRVLFLSIALIIVISLIAIVLVGTTLGQILGWPGHNQGLVSLIPGATPAVQGSTDVRPTFPVPTPGTGQGSTQSSQPPSSTNPTVVPTSEPTVTLTPTPTIPSGGPLSVQITSVPLVVNNNTVVPVGVTTNQVGIIVQLFVTYSAPPGFYTSGQQLTDGSGMASLSWSIHVLSRSNTLVTARLVAIARTQNGQQTISPPVTVHIVNGFPAGG